MTPDALRVVVNDTLGAPVAALLAALAPMAPEPSVPVASTPDSAMTVSEPVAADARVAVTVSLICISGEKARQISAVPAWPFARFTSTQFNPAPETLVT